MPNRLTALAAARAALHRVQPGRILCSLVSCPPLEYGFEEDANG
jgi:hypothetical protein